MEVLEYKPLKSLLLKPGAGYQQPSLYVPSAVRADSPAIEVMTDLRLVVAATVDAGVRVDVANQAMITRGVRSLLVTEAAEVVGLLTAHDILGERPLQVVRERALRHDELCVCDIMTARESVEVLDIDDVLRARVGHIVQTLKSAGRQHALVVETDTGSGRHMIRGIFSVSQIARQLGIAIHTTEVARTFAEIEAIVAVAS